MNPKRHFLFIATILFSVSSFGIDTIYISGVKHRLTTNDFHNVTETSGTAIIDVYGDSGQPVFFDIKADVHGNGWQDYVITGTCIKWEDGRCTVFINESIYYLEFKFTIELKVTCSGHAVGTSMFSIEEDTNGQKVSDTKVTTQLEINETRSFGGQCRQLRIDYNLIGSSITKFDVELMLTSEF